MAENDKTVKEDKTKTTTTARKTASADRSRQGDSAPTVEEDREQLNASAEQQRNRGGRAVEVEVDPAETQKNHADWLEGREPNDVVEVEGQRETAEARMARNGQSAPEKQAGATTLR